MVENPPKETGITTPAEAAATIASWQYYAETPGVGAQFAHSATAPLEQLNLTNNQVDHILHIYNLYIYTVYLFLRAPRAW